MARSPGSGDLGRFRLLAGAVAGRPVEVVAAGPGEPAWSDGNTIFSDEPVADVLVQAALLGAGSLGADVIEALGRRPGLIPRYLAVEGHRALIAMADVLPPGIHLVDVDLAGLSESPARSLTIARSRVPLPDPPAVFGTIHPRRMIDATAVRPPNGRVMVPRPRNDAPIELEDTNDDAGVPLPDWITSPVGGGGPLGRLLARLFGEGRGSGAGSPGADDRTRWTHRPGGRAPAASPAIVRPGAEPGAVLGAARTRRYPEWDVHRRSYRPEWCTVREVPPDSRPGEALPLTDTHALRRRLAPIGTDLERRHRQPQGDDLDIDAVVEARVSLAAGSVPDEAVYVDSVRTRRDLAVFVLLDVSGSAGEPSPAGGCVHDHQRAAAAALSLSLHGLGDRIALYGFRSQGRSRVDLIPVKRFQEPVDTSALRRLGGLTPGAYTRLGAAIRHGAAVLEAESGNPRRLLVVLSDGFAYDHGYDGRYGEADARRALAEARQRGTGCLCISVGASTELAALRRVFGPAAHAAIARPAQLADVAGPLFRVALQSAEAQRRNHQHRARARERLLIERRTA